MLLQVVLNFVFPNVLKLFERYIPLLGYASSLLSVCKFVTIFDFLRHCQIIQVFLSNFLVRKGSEPMNDHK
jgi:hypothetical protein